MTCNQVGLLGEIGREVVTLFVAVKMLNTHFNKQKFALVHQKLNGIEGKGSKRIICFQFVPDGYNTWISSGSSFDVLACSRGEAANTAKTLPHKRLPFHEMNTQEKEDKKVGGETF